MKGAVVQDEGEANMTCRHRNMPTQTATCIPRDTQADSRTGAAGHTHMGTREVAGYCCTGELRGGTHPRETDPCTYPRTGSHGDAVTQGQGGVAVTHTEKVTIARMHEHRAVAHSLTLQKTLSLTGTHVLT